MSVEAIETPDLLSAYLIGDATQDERTAVEKWLATDSAARELHDELLELVGILKGGAIEASPELDATLRRVVHEKIEEKRLKMLVAVSVIGDLSGSEKAEVQSYLETHPSAVAAQRHVAAVSLLLNTGQRAASDDMAEKLRERLKVALPKGVVAPQAASVHAQKVETPRAEIKSVEFAQIVTPSAQEAAPISTSVIHIAPTNAAVSGKQDRPSLRVFVAAAENPWKKRALAAGSLAALVALAFGARSLWNTSNTSGDVAKDTVVIPQIHGDPDNEAPASNHTKVGDPVAPIVEGNPNTPNMKVAPSLDGIQPIAPNRPNLANGTPVTPPNLPVEDPATRVPAPAPVIARGTPNKNDPSVKPLDPTVAELPKKAPDVATPKNDLTPTPDTAVAVRELPKNNSSSTPSTAVVPVTPPTPVAPADPAVAVIPNDPTNNNTAQGNTGNGNSNSNNGSSNGNGGGGAITSGTGSSAVASGTGNGATAILPPTDPNSTPTPIKPTNPPLTPTAGGNTIPPQDGAGVTGVLKGSGTVQVTSAGGALTTLKATGDLVPSGSTVVSDDARVSLVLPGNGRLYIARFSNLKVTFSGMDTQIELNGGEVYYIAPAGGSLTLTAVKAKASKITEADVGLTAGKLTAYNFNATALEMTATKENTLRVASGIEASVAVDGSSPVKRDPAPALNGLWRTDVLVAGDGIKAAKKR